ncbi:MAG: phospholipase D-like domain-containing protein, partial [Burkholderiales bacterium]
HVLQQRRHPTAAIAWVLFILLMPYLALPAFLTFGSRKQARPRNRPLLAPPATDAEGPWAIQTALALGQPQPAPYDDLRIHADGAAALDALWHTIDGARHTIDLCTFIIGRDAVGHALIDRLIAKARAGVQVRLMLDGLGSLMSRRPDLRPLRAAGVQLTLFVPPLHSPLKGRTNLRDHRKLLVADAGFDTRRLWCGGRNLASEYFEGEAGAPPWRDLSFDLRGAFVLQASALFEHDWAFANDAKRHVEIDGPRTETASPESAQMIASGPDQADDTVYSLLVTAAYRARRCIALITPYFVPDSALLTALCLAARRGVQVDLLLPARSNHRLSDVARRRALRALAAAGANLWTVPHMMHAKLAVIDDTLALAGSANLDSRSLFLNYELMVAFHDREAIARFASWFEHERADAESLVPKRAGLFADIAEGLVLWMGFQL